MHIISMEMPCLMAFNMSKNELSYAYFIILMQLESFDNNNTHALSCFPEIIIHCFYYFGEFEPFDRLFYIVILYIYIAKQALKN